MKTIKKISVIATIAMSMMLLPLPFNSIYAQGPGNPPSGSGAGDAPVGGGAPIGGGSLILLGMAALYGGKKAYNYVQNKEQLEE